MNGSIVDFDQVNLEQIDCMCHRKYIIEKENVSR